MFTSVLFLYSKPVETKEKEMFFIAMVCAAGVQFRTINVEV